VSEALIKRLATLSPKQRVLLERKLREQGIEIERFQILARTEDRDHYPLSFAQQRLWFLFNFDPTSSVYHIATPKRLQGAVDPALLWRSVNAVVARHEALRTVFGTVDDLPVQRVLPRLTLVLPVIDLSALDPEAALGAGVRLTTVHIQRPFDLTTGPLLSVALLRYGPEDQSVLMSMHHIVSDGWSLGILYRELMSSYAALAQGAPSPLPPLPIQYPDFAIWQREWLEKKALDEQLDHWKEKLAGLPAVTELPFDRTRPTLQTYVGHAALIHWPRTLLQRLRQLASEEKTTLFVVLLAAWGGLLHRWLGISDVVVGSPIAGRNREEVEGLIGFFVNTLVLRQDFSATATFRQAIEGARAVNVDASANQDLPFERLVDELQPERSMGHNPLFQVSFSFQFDPGSAEAGAKGQAGKAAGGGAEAGGALTVLGQEGENPVSMFDLSLLIDEQPAALVGRLVYSVDLFDRTTMLRLSRRFVRFLAAVISEPDGQLQRQVFLSRAERHQLLREWNDRPSSRAPERALLDSLPARFRAAARRAPDAIAVACKDEWLSYAELDARTDRLAARLRARGVGPEMPVAMALERSPRLVVAILAILKAGGAYLPLDPAYPQDRLAFTVADSGATVLLSEQPFVDELNPAELFGEAVAVVDLSAEGGEDAVPTGAASEEFNAPGGNALAYIIYTSGSTGKPKGVQVTHRNALRLFATTEPTFQFAAEDVWTLFHSYAFDFSVWELWGALLHGGRLEVVPYGVSRAPDEFRQLLSQRRVTVLNQTPSAFRQLIQADLRDDSALALRWVVFGGEALEFETLRPWYDRHADDSPRLVNMYGITETTVHVTERLLSRADLDSADGSVIGVPIPDLSVHVVGSDLRPVPLGASGEMVVGGEGLARGYQGRPSLTAELPDPFAASPGGRLYRSGDLARYTQGGQLSYLGRIDNQVKVRGFRIELGEIEAALLALPEVREAVVLARRDDSSAARLVGYLVQEEGDEDLSVRQVRERLSSTLPDYMVPSALVHLSELPLTVNGKVDRRALPAPGRSRGGTAESYATPQTSAEELLAQIWGDVIGVEKVGREDNFFDLGGDSIMGLQIVARAKSAGLTLVPRQIFQFQTIAELAAVAGSLERIQAEQGPVVGPVGLTPIQHWFLEADPIDVHHHNQALYLRITPPLDGALVRAAVHRLLLAHDALRLRFAWRQKAGQGKLWRQHLRPASEVTGRFLPFAQLDLSRLDERLHPLALQQVAARVQSSLDPVAGRLLRTLYLTFGPEHPARLLWVVHHLAVDGVSWRILQGDLQQLAEQLAKRAKGGSIPEIGDLELPAKTTSVQRWSGCLVKYAGSARLRQEVEYWCRQQTSVSALPIDHQGGDNTEESTAIVAVRLDAATTRALLQEVPPKYHTQINDALLAALARACAEWTGERNVLIDLEGHGRESIFDDVDLSRTVGWFTSVFPLLLELGGAAGPGEELKAIKEQLRAVPNNGVGFGILRYLTPDPEVSRRLSLLRPSEISFNYLGQFGQRSAKPSPRGSGKPKPPVLVSRSPEGTGPSISPRALRRHKIDVVGVVEADCLQLNLFYSRNLHQRATIERLGASLEQALVALVDHCRQPEAGGFTPSDFPLAGLDQTTLDELSRHHSGMADLYPLAPLQHGILFHAVFAPTAGAYHMQLACAFNGPLDVGAFHRAWEQVVERHPIMRTRFEWQRVETPLQVVLERVEVPFAEEDLRGLSGERQRAHLATFLSEDRRLGFDPSKAPLMRLRVMRFADQHYRVIWSHHHLLLDGWCMHLVYKEVFALYEAQLGGAAAILPTIRPYRDYIRWLSEQDGQAARAYWRRILDGFEAPTPLAVERPASSAASDEPATVAESRRVLSLAETETLKESARRQRLTANTLLQGAWAILLARYSATTDVVFGVTVSGRPADMDQVESMIGLFINTLPARVEVADDMELGRWLGDLQSAQAEMRQYEFSALSEVQGWSDIPGGTALFDSIVVFENYPVDTTVREQAAERSSGGFSVSEVDNFEQTSFGLTLMASLSTVMPLDVMYDANRFDAVTIERILGHLSTLLLSMCDDEEARLGTLPMLPEAERRQLVVEWNSTAVAYPREPFLVQLFEERATLHPERRALEFAGEWLSYGELNGRANQLAHYLLSVGVEHEQLVAVAAERSLEMVIALLAILKAGAAYLPVDPSLPRERQEFMLRDGDVNLLLTQERYLDQLPASSASRVALDGQWEEIARHESCNLDLPLTAVGMAYMIYTSGSTGQPKGVINSHGAILNRILWMQEAYPLDESDVVLQKTPYSFDVSVWEFFWPLAVGARLVVARPGGHQDSRYLAELIGSARVTTLHFVPSMLRIFLTEEDLSTCASLRRVICSGEALPRDLKQSFAERISCELHNLYGPTEAAVDVTEWSCFGDGSPAEVARIEACREAATVPIGQPIANLEIHLLDPRGEPVPVAVAGELHIGGVGLARGYWKRPALTAEKFVPNPFAAAGSRLYRTGDLVRRWPGGAMEFLSRIDFQVKIHGLRIELGEIEGAILELEEVHQTVVVVREENSGCQQLVGYLVAKEDQKLPTLRDLRERLATRLPEYMVPSLFIPLARLPLSPNGKVNRKALPSGEEERLESVETFVAARDPVEEALATIWRQVLRREQIGVHDNFFELGGDSILSLQVVSLAARAGLQLTARQVFAHNTIADLAAVAGSATEVEAEQGAVVGSVPLTPIQHWFFEQERAEPHHFNQAFFLAARPLPDHHLMRRVIERLMVHHDVLRSRFEVKPSGAVEQRILAPAGLADEVLTFDLSNLGSEVRATTMRRLVGRTHASLNLARGPIFRCVLFDLGAERGARLFSVMHHLVMDGVSWRIFLEDLPNLYLEMAGESSASEEAEPLAALAAKSSSYQAWARRLAEYATDSALPRGEMEHWIGLRSGGPVELQRDGEGGENLESTCRSIELKLSAPETVALLEEVPRAYRTRIDDVLLTAVSGALREMAGGPVLIDLEGHGREAPFEEIDLSRTLGWFTTIYPVLLDPGAESAPGEALMTVKEQLRAVPGKGLGYGVLRYLASEEVRGQLAALPQAQISFNYLGQLDRAAQSKPTATAEIEPTAEGSAAHGVASVPPPVHSGPVRFGFTPEPTGDGYSARGMRRYLVDIDCKIVGGHLHIALRYSEVAHRTATARRLLDLIGDRLRQLIAHCLESDAGGYTPSDFPLAQLDAATLRKVVGGRRGIEDIYPLLPTQQGMLFFRIYAPGSYAYHQQNVRRLGDGVEVEALVEAWKDMVATHPILRTSFAWEDLDEPLQIVHEKVDIPWRLLDWRDSPSAEHGRMFERYLEEDRRLGFDLSRPPLMRCTLIRTAENSYIFCWNYHHILLDGWSLPVLYNELFQRYLGHATGRSRALLSRRPFRDYVAWNLEQDIAKAERFWRSELSGFQEPTSVGLETAMVSRSEREESYAAIDSRLFVSVSEALQRLGSRYKVSQNAIAQAAWGLVLSRFSNQEDVLFGATVSGRSAPLPGMETMLGLFINTLPVRVQAEPEAKVGEWIQGLQDRQLAAREFEYSSLMQVQGWSEVASNRMLFESILVFENYPEDLSFRSAEDTVALNPPPTVPASGPASGPEPVVEAASVPASAPATGAPTPAAASEEASPVELESFERTSYPITVVVMAEAEEWTLLLGYDRHYLDFALAARLLATLRTVLGSMAQMPRGRLGNLPLMLPNEIEQLIASNQTQVEFHHADLPMAELLATRWRDWPDSIALLHGEEHVTYGQLDRRVGHLARLLRGKGVGPEVKVAIHARRSTAQITAMLAVLRAGGAYLPLDPDLPAERQRFMLEDSGAALILSDSPRHATDALGEVSGPREVIALRYLGVEFDALGGECLAPDDAPRLDAENLAYLIYTSGSTGLPKAVMISQRSMVDFVLATVEDGPVRRQDRVLQFASIAFDTSVEEIFPALLEGGTLVLRDDAMLELAQFVESCHQYRLSVLDLPTAYWRELTSGMKREGLRLPASIELVIIGGEKAQAETLVQWMEVVPRRVRLLNTYGPTEATVVATQALLESEPTLHPTYGGGQWSEVPIGGPRANARAFALDRFGNPLAPGVPGELHLGGTGLARGYLARPGLTAESFVPDPHASQAGSRLYRTGDRVRRSNAGELEFLGRIDDQVKVRGYRIELGEIEAALQALPEVEEAAVVVARDGGGSRLVAFVVPRSELPEWVALRRRLAKRLPDYMIPSALVELAAMPKTTSQKIDRGALTRREASPVVAPATFLAPRTDLEKRIAGIWSRLFKRTEIGVDESFFELGGESLLALRLMSEIRQRTGVSLALARLFEDDTIADLARAVEAEREGSSSYSPLVEIQSRGEGGARFCVHPAGGEVLCYADLAAALGPSHPFLGLQAAGLVAGSEPIETVAEMATSYVAAMRGYQTKGPYRILGWSVGGVIAVEMARQLRAEGAQVASVVLLDTLTPARMPVWDDLELERSFVGLLGLPVEGANSILPAGLEHMDEENRLSALLAAVRRSDRWSGAASSDELRRQWRVYKTVVRAVEKQGPTVLDVPALLVRAGDEAADNRAGEEPTLGWSAFLPNLRVGWVAGAHENFVFEPRVSALARLLISHEG